MLTGAALLCIGLTLGVFLPGYSWLLALWVVLGIGYSLTQTPSGRLLRRSSHQEDRPALFAAHFALSHACWLITYPLAGWLGTRVGLPMTFALLALLCAATWIGCRLLWSHYDPEQIEHSHAELPPTHVHLSGSINADGHHVHTYLIDDQHRHWPTHK